MSFLTPRFARCLPCPRSLVDSDSGEKIRPSEAIELFQKLLSMSRNGKDGEDSEKGDEAKAIESADSSTKAEDTSKPETTPTVGRQRVFSTSVSTIDPRTGKQQVRQSEGRRKAASVVNFSMLFLLCHNALTPPTRCFAPRPAHHSVSSQTTPFMQDALQWWRLSRERKSPVRTQETQGRCLGGRIPFSPLVTTINPPAKLRATESEMLEVS